MNYIYGMHEPGAEHLFDRGGVRGTIVFTHGLGHDVGDSYDYSHWTDDGYTCIARLNHGYGEAGTLPPQEYASEGVQRIANWVQGSVGCSRWIIGNEPNFSVEWPNGEPISAGYYVAYYVSARNAIHALPGHETDEVILAPVAPWNVDSGDWLAYFEGVIQMIRDEDEIDAIALHTYTHGADPSLVFSTVKMDEPYADRFYNFAAFNDFINRIPTDWQGPLYITETDQDGEWENVNSGWVQNAYKAIDYWNQKRPDRQIRCLCLYRWPNYDRFGLVDKDQVHEDLVAAMSNQYQWKEKGMNVIYVNSFEGDPPPFYDQDGAPELTIPLGHTLVWEGERPEFDYKVKDQGEPEVYEGNIGGNGFLRHELFHWWLVTDPIDVTPGVSTTGGIWTMILAHGIEGDDTRPGDCGARLGIVEACVDDPQSEDILWSDWWVVRGNLDNEYKWEELNTPVFAPREGRVRLILEGVANVAANLSSIHYDAETISQEADAPPPPPNDWAELLRAHANTLRDIAVDLDEIAVSIGGNPAAKELIETAQDTLDRAVGLL